MALTISQVNQGFLALFGRPATGAEAAKFASLADVAALADTLLKDKAYQAQLSAPIPSFKQIDTEAATDDAFVESAYQALVGRAADAEGKTFWLNVLAAGVSRDQVVKELIDNLTAQAAEGTTDGLAFQTIVDEDKAASAEWVESLYQNLLARASDAEGLDYWSNVLIQGITGGQVIAAFVASAVAQGTTTEDGQNFAAKQAVADNFTTNFNKFNNLVTANEQALVLGNLKTMMDGVNKDYQAEQYTEEINKIVNEYQNIKSLSFTKADDDDLGIDPETGESNLTTAANFTGTYNLTDETKGTIQSSDRATGSEAFLSDTLTVNVTGFDKDANPVFDIGNLPSTTSVEKLYINNGAAAVSGDISGDFEYINVKGTGGFNITASTTSLKDIVLNSGATKEGEDPNSFKASQSVTSIKTAAGDDTIDLTGSNSSGGTTYYSVSKSINTGAGKDTVHATLDDKATADLGAGDDTFRGFLRDGSSITAGAGDDTIEVLGTTYKAPKDVPVSTIEIDGGTGTDTLDLSSTGSEYAAKTAFLGIKSIKGVEKLVVGTDTGLMASAVSGQKLELSGTSMILDATGANAVDLSKFTNADGANVEIRINNVKTGNVNLETTQAGLKAIKEKVVLTKDASKVSVKGFEQGNDEIGIVGVVNSNKSLADAKAAGIAADTLYTTSIAGDASKVTTAKDLNKLLGLDGKTTKLGLNEKDEFFILAYDDSTDPKNSTAKVYKAQVGKDGTVAKVAQMATINVANREVINPDTSFKETSANPVELTFSGATLDLSTNKYDGKSFIDADKIYVNAVKGALEVKAASDHVNTVDAFITTNAGKVTKAVGTSADVNVYLGGNKDKPGTNDLDFNTVANNSIASGADTLFAGTKGKITLKDASSFGGTAAAPLKLDLSKVDATIAISGDVATASGDLTKLFTGADSGDKISFTANNAAASDTFTLTAASETVTVKNAIVDDTQLDLTTMFKGAAANDAITAKVGVNTAGVAASIKLSAAKDTVDVSAAKGNTAALTITATDFAKANDKIDFGTAAAKGELGVTALAAEVATSTTIEKISVVDGKLNLLTSAGEAVAADKATIANALSALTDTNAKSVLLNKVLFFTDGATGTNYLITEGASSAAIDDVAIALTGVDTTGFSIANGVVTLA